MMKIWFGGVSALVLAAAGQAAATDLSTTWHAQIGDTATVQTQSKGGAGITIAFVDSGVVGTNAEVAGYVASRSACAAVTFTCSSSYNDDNGHGTAVASIAAGRYSATAPQSMSGVAPAAMILAEKALNASGSGYDTDLASGINKAVAAGAQVINLSVTYVPTTAVINAINNAAAHNAVIVWAAGNAATNFDGGANTSGLSTAALSRLIIVGSVSSTNVLSTFSNKPGAGSMISGKTKASYASLWLEAPGQNIAAPGIQFGSTAYAYWSGTSMSAPEVSGAVALLEATWPILITNGTAAKLLFTSATDLGATGVDNIYGNGLLNIAKAFQPVGTLSVTSTTGSSIPVTSMSTSLVSGTAFGAMPMLSKSLSSYTSFDTFQRNFNVNLSSMVVSPRGGAGLGQGPAPVANSMVSGVRHFAGGGYVEVSSSRPASFAEAMFGDSGASDIADRMFGARDRGVVAMTLVDGGGDVIAMGRGVSSTPAFAEALWGADSSASEQSARLGVSTALLGLAQGGDSGAFGYNFSDRARLAVGWSSTDLRAGTGLATDRTRSGAKAITVGLNLNLSHRWTAGVSYSALGEQNGLLGSTYDGAGPLGLGSSHASRSMSVSSAYDLGDGRGLMFDATVVTTDGAALSGGLVRDVSAVKARAFGVSFVQADALRAGDRFTVAVRKPLRVTSGQVDLAVTQVDDQGEPTTSFVPVSLAPDGNETDLSFGYAARLGGRVNLGGTLDLRSDAGNIKGRGDVALSARMAYSF